MRAQVQTVERTAIAVFPCELAADEVPPASYSGLRIMPPRSANAKRAAAVFEVTYNGFPADARAAFQAAVDLWSERITSPVPIRINANWSALGTNILGSAGPFLVRDFDDAPSPGTWYPSALANAFAGRDLSPDGPDIEATFNSDFGRWYLGTDGNPPPGDYDLTTVVLHELTHGLGFIGAFTVRSGRGELPQTNNLSGLPFAYDRFAEDVQGRSLLDTQVYPRPSMALGDVLQDAVFLGGQSVEAAANGHAPLYAPPSWNEGSSYSHFDEPAPVGPVALPVEATFRVGEDNALMTPFIAVGEVIRDPGPLACAALRDIGWALAPACADLLPEGPPLPDVFALDLNGPNPFAASTSVQLQVETPQRVQAWLFDATGRRLATLLDATIAEGVPRVFDVSGEHLASGVYFVHVVGEVFSTTMSLTHMR